MSNVGKNVAKFRQLHGMTQQELSARTGITQGQISNIEHGRHEPKLNHLRELAQALQVTIDQLNERLTPAILPKPSPQITPAPMEIHDSGEAYGLTPEAISIAIRFQRLDERHKGVILDKLKELEREAAKKKECSSC